jgi:hypothetical protein
MFIFVEKAFHERKRLSFSKRCKGTALILIDQINPNVFFIFLRPRLYLVHAHIKYVSLLEVQTGF